MRLELTTDEIEIVAEGPADELYLTHVITNGAEAVLVPAGHKQFGFASGAVSSPGKVIVRRLNAPSTKTPFNAPPPR